MFHNSRPRARGETLMMGWNLGTVDSPALVTTSFTLVRSELDRVWETSA
jgi:hypothetical protein